ncbi:kinesin-like protein KIN-4C [Brassica napus]|nr:kinesin-like protein KIN-4C [Brassica napus]
MTQCYTRVHVGSHTFMYDFVFGNAGLPSSQIYHRCVAPLVEDLFKGYNATVLAYGQTASGKTYTMGMGTNCGTSDGIIPKVMEYVFTRVEAVKSQIRVSFLEIYNEEIYDLLASNPPSRAPIIIRETASGEITLQGVTEVDVKTKEEMSSYLARGSFARASGSTNMNIQSSRSHAVFTISLQITTAEEILCAKLRLVDLAGSERANRTGADGMRLKEGRHINSSLLALRNVISLLGDVRKRKKGAHVPYRVSKLTRLLQDSLGGKSKTVMIACVSPAISDVEETLNTLRYANCARNIKNQAVVQKQKTYAPSFMFKELTPSKSEAKNKAVVQKHKPSVPSFDYDAMFKELTPSKSESLPVYDKPVYDKEDVFQDFSELKIPWPSQAARFDDLFASTSSRSELRKPVYDKPVYDEDVFEAITELQYNEDVFEAIPELQCDEDVFEAISELQIPSTSQPDDVFRV